mmetsp:Transcript_141026/g.351723  ORF Transcript_141026/g.351723 Transcript_141026/m.351723 type:complete len:175 (+) Transcript_141026:386-910(+)
MPRSAFPEASPKELERLPLPAPARFEAAWPARWELSDPVDAGDPALVDASPLGKSPLQAAGAASGGSPESPGAAAGAGLAVGGRKTGEEGGGRGREPAPGEGAPSWCALGRGNRGAVSVGGGDGGALSSGTPPKPLRSGSTDLIVRCFSAKNAFTSEEATQPSWVLCRRSGRKR